MTAYQTLIDALRAAGQHVIETSKTKRQRNAPATTTPTRHCRYSRARTAKGPPCNVTPAATTPTPWPRSGCTRDLYDDTGMRNVYKPNTDYIYPNGDRKRRRGPGGTKDVKWAKGANGGRTLYFADKIPDDCPLVFITEGEKGAEAIWAMGAVAVSTGGAARTDCDFSRYAAAMLSSSLTVTPRA